MAGFAETWQIRTGLGSFELEIRPEGRRDARTIESSMRDLRLLGWSGRGGESAIVLREILERLRGPCQTERPGRLDVDALLAAARIGTLVVRRLDDRAVLVPVVETRDAVLGPEPEPTEWIEIEVVDQKGKPIPNVDYRIECADGRVRTGTTNLSGLAREEGLHGGDCKVSFPRVHGPDWSKLS
jgi:hypothetical protein